MIWPAPLPPDTSFETPTLTASRVVGAGGSVDRYPGGWATPEGDAGQKPGLAESDWRLLLGQHPFPAVLLQPDTQLPSGLSHTLPAGDRLPGFIWKPHIPVANCSFA